MCEPTAFLTADLYYLVLNLPRLRVNARSSRLLFFHIYTDLTFYGLFVIETFSGFKCPLLDQTDVNVIRIYLPILNAEHK